eukprot:GHVU01070924.1.p1 GENE.GHVU01070924.1~~GHVU01070924.1.p1  ORF type:complete len:108 (+),score=16.62 GHVU01070924.1:115-438(+)
MDDFGAQGEDGAAQGNVVTVAGPGLLATCRNSSGSDLVELLSGLGEEAYLSRTAKPKNQSKDEDEFPEPLARSVPKTREQAAAEREAFPQKAIFERINAPAGGNVRS